MIARPPSSGGGIRNAIVVIDRRCRGDVEPIDTLTFTGLAAEMGEVAL